MDVLTPINGYEWPVPILKDTNLDLIRIEMLNAGEEYAWLDVLCLRQVGGQREDLHAEEWKVDMPTIGRVYIGFEPVMYYFNGWGRPLHIKAGDFESDRSWFRRVWTLQEFSRDRIISGDMGDDDAMEEEVCAEIDRWLLVLEEISCYHDWAGVWTALSHMQDWYIFWGMCTQYQRTMRCSPSRMHGQHWWTCCLYGSGPLCSLHIPDLGTETKFGDHHGAR